MKFAFRMFCAVLPFAWISQPNCAGQVNPAFPTAQNAPQPASGSTAGTAKPSSGPDMGKDTGKPASGATDEPYVVGALDVLDIRVWNDQKLSGMFDVRPDGMLSMSLIGEFRADGLTVSELTNVIKEKLTTVMNDPEVNVQVARINSKKYYIYGGVYRAGQFPLIGKTTVLDALADCGGFKDFANKKDIRIMRGTQEFRFNYNNVIKGKQMEQNIALRSGDRIYVPE